MNKLERIAKNALKKEESRAELAAFIKDYDSKPKVGIFGEPKSSMNIEAGGVNRVIQIANKKPYVAITASRGELTPDESRQRNKELLGKIRAEGLYAYNMVGVYQECPVENQDCSVEEQVEVVEDSFFVGYREDAHTIVEFIEFFNDLRRKYAQDSILVGLPANYDGYESDTIQAAGKTLKVGKHYFLGKSLESVGTKASPAVLEEYGSIAIDPKKNRIIEFAIQGTLQPNGAQGRMFFKKLGLTWVGCNDNGKASINERATRILKDKNKI